MAAATRAAAKSRLFALVALVAGLHALVLESLRVELAPASVAPQGARPILVQRVATPPRQAVDVAHAHPFDNRSMAAAQSALATTLQPVRSKSASIRIATRATSEPAPTAPAVTARDEPAPAATLEVPVYSTIVPASADLHYELRRGARSGLAELSWRRVDARYEANLEGTLDGREALRWISHGGVDDAGVAPERFTARARSRAVRAANFQRDVGKITYSGPRVEHPLPAGAQDRLSWLVQLAAIGAADPRRMASGEQVVLYVTGVAGDADVWVFVVAGLDEIATPGGSVEAVRLHREPKRPYDTRAEVWLDPARQWLPARLRLSYRGDDRDTLELTRID